MTNRGDGEEYDSPHLQGDARKQISESFIWLIKKLNMGSKKIAYFCYSLKLHIDLVDYREEFNFLPYGRWFYRGRPIRVKK